jgi:hypothetical protein
MAGERLAKALKGYRGRYGKASSKRERGEVLTEFCKATGYHRKYAIALLNRHEEPQKPRRRRSVSYSKQAMRVVERIWEKAGHPWSKRLKALLPLWLPWARKHIPQLTPEVEEEVLKISARQIDRRLKDKKRALKRKVYGRTKPGTLLKHTIPIKTAWRDAREPGYVEIDLVAHCGPCASGEFGYSLNLTDLYTGWVETRAILGKSEGEVVKALDEMRRQLPFPCARLSPITVRNSSTTICSGTAATAVWSSGAPGPTRRTTTPTSSKRTGPTSANSSDGSATTLPRPWPP